MGKEGSFAAAIKKSPDNAEVPHGLPWVASLAGKLFANYERSAVRMPAIRCHLVSTFLKASKYMIPT